MRKIDEKKPSWGKAAKTINFDKEVLKRLEERAIADNTTVSFLNNALFRNIVMRDEEWHKFKAKEQEISFSGPKSSLVPLNKPELVLEDFSKALNHLLPI